MGMLVDHSIDSISPTIVTIAGAAVLRLDSLYTYTQVYFMATIPFYYKSLEYKYLGELNLPIVHGPSEGTLIIAAVFHYIGFYSVDAFLVYYDILGYKIMLKNLIVLVFFLSGIVITLQRYFK